jgi:retron-type reverse transcriptase
MHYCFDKWLKIHNPEIEMVRYADDIIVHCRNYQETTRLLAVVKRRLTECGVAAHPQKTKIVYC